LFPLFATSVVYTSGKFSTGVGIVLTTLAKMVEKFAAGVVDTGGKFATGVVGTAQEFAGFAICGRKKNLRAYLCKTFVGKPLDFPTLARISK
jgi:hypothetical protein